MTILPTTTYFVVKNSALQNIKESVPQEELDLVLDELEELAQPTPGNEESAHVYTKVLAKKDVERTDNPNLADCISFYMQDTGKELAEIIQWNTPESMSYLMLKNDRMIDIEDELGAMDSKEFEEIASEIDRWFEPIEDNMDPSMVRVLRFTKDDLYEDEGHNESLRTFVKREIDEGNKREISVFQWTE